MDATPEQRALHDALAKKFTDEGRLIELGWVAFRFAVVSPAAPPVQINEMRIAFMAGAQHLFASLIAILDPGSEPSLSDMARMSMIAAELEAFANEMRLRAAPTTGAPS